MMAMLMVKCKSCGKEFPTDIPAPPKELWDVAEVMDDNSFECPFCKQEFVYDNKSDYFLPT